ncbi:hypothetical protein [Bifidobacterium tissieri]|uniref:Sugar-binding protein n=1 Tax=Bifidobacterium tissieri TaxID=1630162 RepID=A0A5M9ZQX6_9BIFI|nr:hypothetical protein [Bifidobacterium tissieri]KAA8830051.1 hypothetical protein EMO89_06545 [Bifidobacterium tissieri]KAA8831258.1 hypothetical protein EM849_08065 [Bifidobacterium tissieri]
MTGSNNANTDFGTEGTKDKHTNGNDKGFAGTSDDSYDALSNWDIPDLSFPEPFDIASAASTITSDATTVLGTTNTPAAPATTTPTADTIDDALDLTGATTTPSTVAEPGATEVLRPAAQQSPAPEEPVFAPAAKHNIPDSMMPDLAADTTVIAPIPQDATTKEATLEDFSTPIAAAGDVAEGATTPVAPAFAPSAPRTATNAGPVTDAGPESGSGDASSETVVMPKIGVPAHNDPNESRPGATAISSNAGKGGNKRGAKQRRRLIRLVIAAIAAIVLVIAGVLVWKNVSDNRAHSTAMQDCATAVNDYDSATKKLKTAITDAQDEAATAASDVSDATTVSKLKQVINDANVSGNVRDCRNSMPTTELRAAADANGKLVSETNKAIANVNAAAKAVNTSKDSQTIGTLKQQITALLPNAQTTYDTSDGVVDDVTRSALKTAIDNATAAAKKTNATAAELEKAKTALETATANVKDSMPSEESSAGSGSGSSSSNGSSTRRRSNGSSNGSNSSNSDNSGQSTNRYSGNGSNRNQYSTGGSGSTGNTGDSNNNGGNSTQQPSTTQQQPGGGQQGQTQQTTPSQGDGNGQQGSQGGAGSNGQQSSGNGQGQGQGTLSGGTSPQSNQ